MLEPDGYKKGRVTIKDLVQKKWKMQKKKSKILLVKGFDIGKYQKISAFRRKMECKQKKGAGKISESNSARGHMCGFLETEMRYTRSSSKKIKGKKFQL